MYIVFILLFISVCFGKPSNLVKLPQDDWQTEEIENFNVITVPPNCPPGQQWINGKCRDVWIRATNEDTLSSFQRQSIPEMTQSQKMENFNVITVPSNCPTGQQWINGKCRDVWIRATNEDTLTSFKKKPIPEMMQSQIMENFNVITVPPNCPAGQQWINGKCRDVWFRTENQDISKNTYFPITQEIENFNVVTVPPNCPSGQQWINGKCRDVWNNIVFTELMKKIVRNIHQEELNDVDDKDIILQDFEAQNIISVPNQCPNGMKPDKNGICREIF